ncbi:FG-GAP repeat protein [Gammaproteobacteria bacterium]|nr:FG-GAP repeat protein [Gammaproteobacteria bacterium]
MNTPSILCKQACRAGFLVLLISGLSACGGGGGSSSAPVPAPVIPAAPVAAAQPSLSFESVKNFQFTWTDVSDAEFYRLLENPDGLSGFTQVGADISSGVQLVDHVVPLYDRVNAQYLLQSCNALGCTDSAQLAVNDSLSDAIGYFQASNIQVDDDFGESLSLSGDGSTLAVGAFLEDSAATGVDGDQTDNTANASGAVYVFSRSGAVWVQQAYLKASNSEANDQFGLSLSLSTDGNILAVAARAEDSVATGVNGDETDNSASGSGAVYVFSRSGAVWAQQAYLKASNAEEFDQFGISLSLSGDGSTLAVGAHREDGAATGVDGDETDNSADSSGAVYVFSRSGVVWAQQAYLKASNTEINDFFGLSLSLSSDGNTLAVGANGEDSSATGVGGDETDNSASRSGAVYLFSRSGAAWSQQTYLKSSNTEAEDFFGRNLSLSSDGSTLAVGAYQEDSSATGVNGNEADNTASASGAVYVFSHSGTVWTQQAYVKASNTDTNDQFGLSVSLSSDGNALAVGAIFEGSAATGVNGDETDNSADFSGAVYMFSRSGAVWSQQAYLKVKANNTEEIRSFSKSLSLSNDGATLAVGADSDDSVLGDPGSTTSNAGAVYVY